jgi:hypothetical protein
LSWGLLMLKTTLIWTSISLTGCLVGKKATVYQCRCQVRVDEQILHMLKQGRLLQHSQKNITTFTWHTCARIPRIFQDSYNPGILVWSLLRPLILVLLSSCPLPRTMTQYWLWRG